MCVCVCVCAEIGGFLDSDQDIVLRALRKSLVSLYKSNRIHLTQSNDFDAFVFPTFDLFDNQNKIKNMQQSDTILDFKVCVCVCVCVVLTYLSKKQSVAYYWSVCTRYVIE